MAGGLVTTDEAVPAVPDAYAVRLGGCRVLLACPQACLDVLRSLQQSVAAAARQGLPAPGRVLTLIRALDAELADRTPQPTSGTGSPDATATSGVPACHPTDPVDAQEAARMLAVTPRQIRNLGHRLGGRKVGHAWTFDRASISAEAAIRRQERTPA